MKEIIFNQHTVRLYDSIEELNIERYMTYHRYLMLDSGIGSDSDSVLARISQLAHWIQQEEKEVALKELGNMHQSIMFVLEGQSPKMNAFVCLIHSINGKERRDISESGIKDTIKELSQKKLKTGAIFSFLETVKKKFDSELEVFFPAISTSSREIEWHEHLKRKTKILLDHLTKGLPYDTIKSEIEKIDTALLEIFKPRQYSGAKGSEAGFIKRFEETCTILSQYLSSDPKQMTVLAFYQSLETIQNQLKKKNKKR